MAILKLIVLALTVVLALAKDEEQRIFSAVDAPIDFNHHVTIGMCGGSVIDRHWILTSKTCIEKETGDFIKLVFQTMDKSKKGFSVSVKKFVHGVKFHPDADLALIKLPVALDYNPELNKIQLYNGESSEIELNTYSIGLAPGFDNNHSDLKYGVYKLEPYFNGKCKNYNEETEFCTKVFYPLEDGYSMCLNDHGSGLIVGWTEKRYLVGVLTESTCKKEMQKYIKVEKFIPWIKETTGLKF